MGQGHTHLEDECTDSEEEKFYNSELEDSQSECEEDACDKRVAMEARARQATAARLRSVWNEAKKNSSDSASEYEEAEGDRGLQPPLAERSSPLGASHSDGNASFRGPELTDAEDEQGCTEVCRYQQAYFFGSNTSLDSSISQPSCASLDSRLAQISGSSNTYHSRVLPRNFFLDLEREGRGCASASATPLTSPQSPSETRRRWDKSVWPEVERGLRRNQSVPDVDPSRSEDRRLRSRGRSPSPKRYTFDEREKRQKIIDAVTRRLYPGSGPGFGRRTKKVSDKPQVLGERECRCRKKTGSDGDIAASKNSVTTNSCESLLPKTPRKISQPTSVTPPAWRRSSLESPPGSFLPIPVRDHSQAERTSTSPQKEAATTTLTRSSRITRREVKTVTTTVTKTLNTTERKIVTNVQQDMAKPEMHDQAVDCDLVDRDSCEKVSCESKGAQADMQVLETSEDQEESEDSQSQKKCVHPDPDLLTDVKKDDSAEQEGRRKIPLTPALHQLRLSLASLNDPERFSDDSLELGNLDADSPSPASRFSPRVPEDDEMSLGDISKDSLEDSVNVDVESRKLHAAHDPTVVQEITTACDMVSAMPGPRIPKLSKKNDSFIQSFFRSVSASDMKDSFELEEESLSLTDDNSETLCLSPSSAQTLASKPSVPVKSNAATPPPSSSSSRNTRRWTRERAEKRLTESTSSEESDVDARQRPRFRKRRVRRMSLPLPSVPTIDLCEEQDNSDCTEGATLKVSSHETVDSAVCASVKDINANKMLTRTHSKELLDRNRRYNSESVGECGVEDVSVDIASTERKQKLLQFKQKYKNESSQPSNQDSSVVESMSPEYYSPHLQDPVISVPLQEGSNQQFSESDSFSDRDVETQALLKESARKLLRTVSKEGPLSEASQDAVAELLKASSKRLAKYALSMPEDGSEIGSASVSRCESVATQDEDYDTAKGEDSWLESSSEFQSAFKKNGVSGSHSYTSNITTPGREMLHKDEKKQSLEGQGNLLDVVQSSSGGDVSPCAFVADATDYSTTATTPLASSASEGFSTEGSWEDLEILDPQSKGDINLSEKQYQVIAAEFTPRTARRLLYTIIECSESSRSESVPSEPDVIPSDWQETMSETEDCNLSGCVSPEISEDLLSSSDDTMLDTVRRNVEDPQDSLSCISDDIPGDSKAHTAEGYPAEGFQELPWNAAGSLELLTSLPITPDCLDEEDNPWDTDTKDMDQNYQDESNQETCTTSDSGMVCTKSFTPVIQYSQNQEEDMLPEFVPYLDLSEVAGSPIKGHVVNKETTLVSSQDEVTALERHEDVTNVNFNVAVEDKKMQDKMGKFHSETSSAFESRRTLLDTSLGLSNKMPKYTSQEQIRVGRNSKLGALHQEHLEIIDSPDAEIQQITKDSELPLHAITQTIHSSKEMNIGSKAVSCSVPRLSTAVAVESPWQKIDDVSHSSHTDDYLVPVMTSCLKAESSQDSDMEFDSLEQIQVTYSGVQHPHCISDIPQTSVLEGDITVTANSLLNKNTTLAGEAQRLVMPLTPQNSLMDVSIYEAVSSIENQIPINVMEIKPVTKGIESIESGYLKQMPQNSKVKVSMAEASSLMTRNQSERSDCLFEATLAPQNSSTGEAASISTTKDKDVEASCQYLNLQKTPESTEVLSGPDPMVSEQFCEIKVKQAPPLTPQNSMMEVSISEASSLLAEEKLKSRTMQLSPLTPQNSMVDVSISEAASYAVQDAECTSEELLPLAHVDVAEVKALEASTRMLDDRLKSVMPKKVSPLTPQHSMVDVSISEAATSVMLKNYEYMPSQNTQASPTITSEASSEALEFDTAMPKDFDEVPPLMQQNSVVSVSITEAVTSVMLEGKEHALDLNTQSLPTVRSKTDSMLKESDISESRTLREIPPLTPQNSTVEVSISEASSLLLEKESIKPRSIKVCPLTPQNSMMDISITEAASSLLENAKSVLEQPISSVAEETTVDTVATADRILLDDNHGKSIKEMIPGISMSSEAFEKIGLEKDCYEERTLLSAQFSVMEANFTEEGVMIPEKEVKEIKTFSQTNALTPQNSFVEVSISEASSLALENVRLNSTTSKQAILLSAKSSVMEDSFAEAASLVPEKEEKEIKIFSQSKALTPQNSLMEVSISQASSLANVSLNSKTPTPATLLSAQSSVLEDSFAEVGPITPEREAEVIKISNQTKTLTPQNSLLEVSISEASSLANVSLNSRTSKPTTLLCAQSSVLENTYVEAGPWVPEEVQEVKTYDQAKALTPQNSLIEVSIAEASSVALENVSLTSRTSKHGILLSAESSNLEDSFAEAESLVPEKEETEIKVFSQTKALTPQNSLMEVSISEASSLANVSLNSGTLKPKISLSADSSILGASFAEAGSLMPEQDAKGVNIFNLTKALTPQNSLMEVSISEASSLAHQNVNLNTRTCRQVTPLTPQNSMLDISIVEASALASERNEDMNTNVKWIPALTPQNSMADISVGEAASVIDENVQVRSRLRHLPLITPQNTIAEVSVSEASSLILATEGINSSSVQEFSTEQLPIVLLDTDGGKSKSQKDLTPLTPQNSVLEVSISEASTIAMQDEAFKPCLKQVLPLKLSEGKVKSCEMESVKSLSSKEMPPLTPQNSVMEVSIYEAASSIADTNLGSEFPVASLQESRAVEGTLKETHNNQRDIGKVLLTRLEEKRCADACFPSSAQPNAESITQIATSDHSLEVAFPMPQVLDVGVYQETTSFLPQNSPLVTPLTPQNSVADYEMAVEPKALVPELGKGSMTLHSAVAPIPEDRLHHILQEGTEAVMPQMAAEEFQALTHVAQMPAEVASSIIPLATPQTQKINALRSEIIGTSSAQADLHQTPHAAVGYQVLESQTDQLTLPQEFTEELQTLHPRISTVVNSVEEAMSFTPQESSGDEVHPLQQMKIKSNQVVNMAATLQLDTDYDTIIPLSPEVIERDQKVINLAKSECDRGQGQLDTEEVHLVSQLPPRLSNVQAVIQEPEVVMKGASTSISGVACKTQQMPMEGTCDVSTVNQGRLQRSFAAETISSESDIEESCSMMPRLSYRVGNVQAVTSQMPHDAIEETKSTQQVRYETPFISTSEPDVPCDNFSSVPFHATTSKLQTEVSESVIPLAPQTSSTTVLASAVHQTQSLSVEQAMIRKPLEEALEEASCLQAVADSTPKMITVKESSGQAAILSTPIMNVEGEGSEKAMALQTSQMSEVAIPIISTLAKGEEMSVQTISRQTLPLAVEEAGSVRVLPLPTTPLAMEKTGNAQVAMPQTQHMALEENESGHAVIFHPVTSTLSVEESLSVTPLTSEIAAGVQVTSREFLVEGSGSDWAMTYQTTEVSSDQVLPHKTPVTVLEKARSVNGTDRAQASIQQMSQMALEGVVIQTPIYQAKTSSLDLEESHAVMPLLPQKATSMTHQTSHMIEQGTLQTPQVAMGTSTDQTVIYQAPQLAMEGGNYQSLCTQVETSNGQAVIHQSPQVSKAVDMTLQTSQVTVETNFGEAVIPLASVEKGINVQTVDMATKEAQRVQEPKYHEPHSILEENGSAQTVTLPMPQVAKERMDSAQAVNQQTSDMVMEKTKSLHAVMQQAVISQLGLEEEHAVIPLLPEETNRMSMIHKMPHVVNEEMSSAQAVTLQTPQMAMTSSDQVMIPQTLQMAMGESSSAQPAYVQTTQMIMPETSRTQAVIQQAVTSDIDLKEMHFVKPLLPKGTGSMSAVIRQTPQVAEEGTNSAHALIQQAVSSELHLEESHSVVSLLPQDTSSVRTVVHQTAQMAEEEIASAQIETVAHQMPLGEGRSAQAVIQQATSSKLHLDEAHSVIPLVPQDTGGVRTMIHQTPQMTEERTNSIQTAQAKQMALEEDGNAQVVALQIPQMATGRATSAQAVAVQIPQIASDGTSSVQAETAHITQMAMDETSSAQTVTHQSPQMTMGKASSAQTVIVQTPRMAIEGTSSAQVTGQMTQVGVERASTVQAVSQMALKEGSSAQAIIQPAVASQLLEETHSVIPQLPQGTDSFRPEIRQIPQEAKEGIGSAQTVIGQTPQMTVGDANSAQAVTVQTHQLAMGKAFSAQELTSQMDIAGVINETPQVDVDATSSGRAVNVHTPQMAVGAASSAQPVTLHTPQMAMGEASSAQAVTLQTPQMAMGEASSAQAVTLQTPQMAMGEASSAEAVTLQTPQMAMGEASSAQAVTLHTPQMAMGEASSAQAVTLQTPQMAMGEASSAQAVTLQTPQMALGEASSAQAMTLYTPQMTVGEASSAQTVNLQTPKAIIRHAVSSQQSLEETQDSNIAMAVTPRMTARTSNAQAVIQQAVTSQLCLDETHALAKERMSSAQAVTVQTPQMVIGEACSDQIVTLEAYQLATESFINTRATTVQRLEEARHESSSVQAVTIQTPQISMIAASSEQAVIHQPPQMSMIVDSSEQAVINQPPHMSMIAASSEQAVINQTPQMTVVVPISAEAVVQHAVSSELDLEELHSVISLLPNDSSNLRAVTHQTSHGGTLTPQMVMGMTSSAQTVTAQTPHMGSVQAVTAQTPHMGSVQAVTLQTPQVAMDETNNIQAVTVQTSQMTVEAGSAQAVSFETPQMAFREVYSAQAVTVQTPQMTADASSAQAVICRPVSSELRWEEPSSVVSVSPQEIGSAQTVTVETPQMDVAETSSAQAVIAQTQQIAMEGTDSAQAVIVQTPQMVMGEASSAQAIIHKAVKLQLGLEETHSVIQLLPQDAGSVRVVSHGTPQEAREWKNSAQAVKIQTNEPASAQAVALQTPQMAMGEATSAQAVTLQTPQMAMGEASSAQAVTLHTPQASSDQAVVLQTPQMAMGEASSAQAVTLHTPQASSAQAVTLHTPQASSDQAVVLQTPQMAMGEASSAQAVTLHTPQMAMGEASSAQAVTFQTPQASSAQAVTFQTPQASSAQAVTLHTPQMAMGEASSAQAVTLQTPQASSAQAVTLHTPQMAMGEGSSAQAVALQTPQMAMGEATSPQAVTLQTPQMTVGKASSAQAVTLQTPQASSDQAVVLQTPQMAMGEASSAQAVTFQTPQASSAQAVTLHTPQMAMGEASSAQAVTLHTPQMAMGVASSAQAVTLHTPQMAMGEASSAQAVTLHTPQMAMGVASSAQAVTLHTPQMAMGEASSAQAVTLHTPQMAMGVASSAQAVTLQTPQASSAQAVTLQTPQASSAQALTLQTPQASSAQAVTLQTPQASSAQALTLQTPQASSAQAVTLQTPQASSAQALTLQTPQASSAQAVTLQTPQTAIGEDSSAQAEIQQALTSELDSEETHSATPLLPQEINSMQVVIHQTLHVATEGKNSVQAVAEQRQMTVETDSGVRVETHETPQMTAKNSRAQAVIQQAVTSDLGLEESHSVFPLASQETMQADVQQTSPTDMERTRHAQSTALQTAPGSLREASAQSGVLHAASSEVDLEEAPAGTSPLTPKTCSVLSLLQQTTRKDRGVLSGADAVPHQTPHVTTEAGSSAVSVMKETRTQLLTLPSLQMASNVQALKQVTPYIIGATSASTASHQPSEVAMYDGTTLTSEGWERVIPHSNVQTVTRLPTRKEGVICDQEETCTDFAVTQAVASEVDMDESCSLASFLPHTSNRVRVVTNQNPRLAMEGTKPVQTLKQSPIGISQVTSNAQERPYMFMEVPDSAHAVTAQSSVTLGLENPHGPSSIQGVTHHSTEKPNQMEQAVSFGEHYNTVTVNPRGSLKPLKFIDGEDHTPLAASTPINAQTCVLMDKEHSSLEDSAYVTATPTDFERSTKEASILAPESQSGRVAFTAPKVSTLEDTEETVSPLNISRDTLQTPHGRVGHQAPQTRSVSQGDCLFATASKFSYDIEGLGAIPTSNTEDEEKFYTSNTEILENKPEQKFSAAALSLPKREEIIVTSEEEFYSAEDSALVSSSDSVTSMTSPICVDDKTVKSSQVHLENRSEIRNVDMQREKALTASGISTIGNLPCVTATSAKGSESIQNDKYLYKKGHVGNIVSCAQDPNVVVSSCSVPRVTLEQEVSEETYKEKEKTKQAERGEVAGRESSRSRSVDQGLRSALPGNISLPHGNEGQPIASTNVIGQSALAGFGRSTSSVTEEYLAKLQDRDSAMHTSTLSESQQIPVNTKVQDSSNSSKKEGKGSGGKEQGKVARGCFGKLENVVFLEASETNYSVAKAENAIFRETASLSHLGKFIAPDTGTKMSREDKTISFEENKSIPSTSVKVSQRKEVKKIISNEKKSDPPIDSSHATTSTSPSEVNQHLQKRSPDVQRKFIRQATHPPQTVVTGFSNTIMQPQEACEQTEDKAIYKAEQQKPEYTANYSLAKLKRSLYSRKLAGQVFNQMTYPTYEPEREQVQVEDHSTLKKDDSARPVPAAISHNIQRKFDSKSERHDDTQASFQARVSDDKEIESKTTGLLQSFGTRSSAVVSNQQEHQTKNYGKTLNMNVLESKITELKSTEKDKVNIKKDSTTQDHSHGIEVTVSNFSSKSSTATHEDKQTYVVDKNVDNPKLKLTSESWRGQFLMDQSDEWGASDESITFIFMNPDDERPSEDNLLQADVTQSNGSNYRSSSDLSHVGLSFDTSTELKQTHFFDLYKAKCDRLVRSTSLDSVYWNLSKIQVAKQKTEMQRTSSLEEVVTQELEDILARGRRFSSAESDEDDITEDASTVRQNRCHLTVKTHSEQTDSRDVPEASRRRAVVIDADDQTINTSSSGDDDVFAKSPSPIPTFGQVNWCDFKGMILGRPVISTTIRVMSGESSKSSPQLHCRQTPEKLNKKSVSWTDLQGCGALEIDEIPEIRSQESAKLVLPPKSIMKKPSLAPIASTPPPQTPPSPISPQSPADEHPPETTPALRTIRRAAVNSSSDSDDIPLPRSKLKEMFSLQLPEHIRDRVSKTGTEGIKSTEEPEANSRELQSTSTEDPDYSKVRHQFRQTSRPPSLGLSKKSSNSPSLNDSQSSGVSLSFGKSLSTDDNSVSGFSQYSDLFTSSNISLASGFSPSGPTPFGMSSAGFPSSCVVSSQQISSVSTAVSTSEGPLSRGILQSLDSNLEAQDPNSLTNSPVTRMISKRHFGSSYCSSPSDDTASVISTSPINIMSAPTTPATETAPSIMSSHKDQQLPRCRSEGDIALPSAEGFSHTWVALSQVMKEAGTILKTLSETSLVLHHQIANPNQRVALAPVAEEANGTTSPAGLPESKKVTSVAVQTDQHQPSNVKMRSIVAQTSFESSSDVENLDGGGRKPPQNYRRSARRFDLSSSHTSSLGSGIRGKTFSQEINNLRHERERINRILGHYDSSSLHYSRSGSRFSNKSSSSDFDSPVSSLRASLQNLPHTTLDRDLESDGIVGSHRHRLSATSQKYISLHQRRLEESCRQLEERLKLSARKRHLRAQILDNGHSHHHRHAAKVAYHSSLDFAKTPFCERLESPNTTPYLSTTSLPTAGPHSPGHSRELSPCCCVSPIHQPQHNHCRPSAHTCSTHSHWSSCHSAAAADSAYTPHYMTSKIRTSTQKCKEQLLYLRRHLVGASGIASSSSSLGDSPPGRNRYRFGNLNNNFDGPYQRGHAASLSSLPGVGATSGAWRRRVGGSALSVASETEAYRRRSRYRQDSDSDSGAGWSCSGTSLRHSYQ